MNKKEKDILDYNIFMICRELNTEAFRDIPEGYHVRNCRRDEFDIWKKFPFDSEKEAQEYDDFMENYYEENYKAQEGLFFERCKFLCDENDRPIATAFIWKHYGKYTTVNWLKTLKEYEGKGLGRSLLTYILNDVDRKEYPIYLHTQAGSFRAIKLYSDFGFKIIKSPDIIDGRENEINKSLGFLEKSMSEKDFKSLKFCDLKE